MLEIIQDVLRAEERGDALIEEAKQDAARVRAELSEEENRRLREAQTAADRRVREQLAAIREEQERRVAEAQERLRAVWREFAPESDPRSDEAVRRAVRLVCFGPQEER
jgi:vacuolar-type H+-ATPase subunit H